LRGRSLSQIKTGVTPEYGGTTPVSATSLGELKMKFAKLKTMGLAAVVATSVLVPLAYASGIFQGYPIVGSASFCTSQNSQSTANTVPGTIPSGNCTTTTPAGPTTVTGNEVIPADTGIANGGGPATVLLPMSLMTNGYGGTTTNATTGTGQNPVVADGISNYIYIGAGTATFATLTLPPNPAPNQKFCLTDAGTGILTLSSIVVGTTGQLIVGTTPTSIPVATAVGTAGTVTLSTNCWLYVAGTTKTWYRIL
jgi:hypothetical protein